jgi:hypothetical protein
MTKPYVKMLKAKSVPMLKEGEETVKRAKTDI